MVRHGRLLLAAACLASSSAAAGYGLRALAEGAPTAKPLFYAGTLESGGKLASGAHTIALALYDAEAMGKQLCLTETPDVPVEGGRFRVEVSADCVAQMRAQPDLWAALKFTGADGVPHELPRRTKVGAVPYAMEAQNAVSASRAAAAASATRADSAVSCERAANANGALATSLAEIQARLTALETFRTQLASTLSVTGDVSATNNSVGTCSWGGWVDAVDISGDSAAFVCPEGRFSAGVQTRSTPGSNTTIDMVNLLCCEL